MTQSISPEGKPGRVVSASGGSGSGPVDVGPVDVGPVDVIVIGGGIVGCWTAMYLLRQGCRVRLLERDLLGAGASSGNCGYVCPSHVLPLCGPDAVRDAVSQLLHRSGALSVPLRWDPALWRWLARFAGHCTASHQQHAATARHELLRWSMTLYREFLAETGLDCHWQERGLTMVHRHARSMDGFQKTADRLTSEFGLCPVRLDGDRLNQHEPALVDGLAGGWLFPDDTHLDPQKLLHGLREEITAAGGEIMESTAVHRIDVDRGQVTSLQTSGGPMTAQKYVLTIGAESPRFAKPLGCTLPIVPGKGLSMTFPSTAGMPRTPMIFEDSHVAVTPMGGQFRVGSTMQFIGYNRDISPSRLRMIRDKAQSYLTERLPTEPASTWSGWRPMVIDDLPCIDRCPAAANAYVATGNGMIGISTGSGTGRLISEMICQQNPSIDPEPFSLRRFRGRYQQSGGGREEKLEARDSPLSSAGP